MIAHNTTYIHCHMSNLLHSLHSVFNLMYPALRTPRGYIVIILIPELNTKYQSPYSNVALNAWTFHHTN